MTRIGAKISGFVLGGAMALGVAAPLAMPNTAAAEHYSRHNGDYRDNRGHWHHRSGGIGPGKGALIGGAAGTGIGAIAGGGKGALIGGAIGAGGGAIAGKANQDHRDNQYRH
jgi:hypothetical protein